MTFAPYPDDVMDATLAPLYVKVDSIMRENLASIGFSMMDGPAFIREIARWASSLTWANPSSPPAITRRNGVPIETWQDLESMGFQVSVASCIFLHLYNISCTTLLTEHPGGSAAFQPLCIQLQVLETRLHRKFHSMINRLWSQIGAGSYYMSDKALQVHQ